MFKDQVWESAFGHEKSGSLERIGPISRLITNGSGLSTAERLPPNRYPKFIEHLIDL
jgi:hypothetical protein